MTREEIIEQGCPEQPFDFDTDQEEMWYNIVLIHLSDANANAVQFQEDDGTICYTVHTVNSYFTNYINYIPIEITEEQWQEIKHMKRHWVGTKRETPALYEVVKQMRAYYKIVMNKRK